ncbi:glycoside hydrolase family 13 protein [Rhodococcus sp. T2V]|uniref:glycoside hydrolase family 13 protein n=1 Tax=Rhodococcus sp. T2V TaxID=3034164 RepID=UPI0023E2F353|nr:glycoside hydrolase family 13 protein [Rhodococcus sp. T2V]MDF3313334.1 glycoside hydrolase family 13 protein [Rhodococcus sp. T2V]
MTGDVTLRTSGTPDSVCYIHIQVNDSTRKGILMTHDTTADAPIFCRQDGTHTVEWWRDAVVYQVYPRSFADSNGDGIGDIRGIIRRLDHIGALGVDAVWVSPFYVSPMADGGYDVTDYRDIDPMFGTLADLDDLVAAAHDRSLRLIVDLVPNHTASNHPWFLEALVSPPESRARQRYIFRDGKGPDGAEPPNNWTTVRGDRAWTRVDDGQWYLHLFNTAQPDLNWHNQEVHAEFISILRFWLDRGVDGFRVDVAAGLYKENGLPDWPYATFEYSDGKSPMWDKEPVHDVYRAWHRVLAEYPGDRILIAEAFVQQPERLARYIRSDEMQQAFNMPFMMAGYNPGALREAIDTSLEVNGAVGATTSWVLNSHDAIRTVSKFGMPCLSDIPRGIGPHDPQPDVALGLRRARAATLMMLALPGAAYLYQGEELGLPDNTLIPDSARNDPGFFVSNGAYAGRDGCRVPIPWIGTGPSLGFNDTGRLWLPQPEDYAKLAVEQQIGVPGSTLEFYRDALRLRRDFVLGSGSLSWVTSPEKVLAFDNRTVRVIANLSESPVALTAGADILLASDEEAVSGGLLHPDHTVWLVHS